MINVLTTASGTMLTAVIGLYSLHEGQVMLHGKELGSASGQMDGEHLRVFRVDVSRKQRGKGYSLALMQALLQRGIRHTCQLHGVVRLVADEGDSLGLRGYYGRMGFVIDDDEDEREVDRDNQYPMKANIGPTIFNLLIWRAARYQEHPIGIVHLT